MRERFGEEFSWVTAHNQNPSCTDACRHSTTAIGNQSSSYFSFVHCTLYRCYIMSRCVSMTMMEAHMNHNVLSHERLSIPVFAWLQSYEWYSGF